MPRPLHALVAAALLATASSADAARARPALPVLGATAVSGLVSSTRALTARELASDVAGAAAFQRRLTAWGFDRGRERDFQGESKRIDRVVSRTLEFRAAGGALAYVRYLGSHPAALYGPGSAVRQLISRGRAGYLLDAAPCACHRAAPTMLAVLAHGRRVTSIEANGGAVTAAVVRRLVDAAP